MKIIGLQIQNFKRIKAINIHPEGNTVILSGNNAQGKSSVLDAIWSTLAGGDANKEIPMPIREGAQRAEVRIDLGDLIVTKTWTDQDTYYLKVTQKDGTLMAKPQTVLDTLLNKYAFDPLEFMRQSPATQREMLMQVAQVDQTELARLGQAKNSFYTERTLVNREVKNLEGQLAGLPPIEGAPEAEVQVQQLTQEYLSAQLVAEEELRDKAEFERNLAEIKRLQDRNTELRTKWKEYKRPDLNAMKQTLDEADDKNAKFRARQQVVLTENRLMMKREESAKLSSELGAIELKEIGVLAAAKMPIPDLTINEEHVLYRGQPLSQLSSAEKIKVSFAIAMAKAPQLRVISIRDGSLLDADNMKLLQEMAIANNYQVWMEVVGDNGDGIVIEDGMVKNQPLTAADVHAVFPTPPLS